MTKDNATKKAIRERMAITEEPYSVAARNHRQFTETPINVIDLGEDGDAWFVEGTIDIEKARAAIKTTLEGYYQGDDDWLPESLEVLADSKADVRYDWFWRPLFAEYPHDDAVLRNKTQHGSEYARQDLFTGIHFS